MRPGKHRWVTGDRFGLAFPADPVGLRRGGPRFLTDAFRVAAAMGVAWLLDVPALIRKRFGADPPASRMDPRIKDDESVRAPLQVLSNLLNLWERHRLAELLDTARVESPV
jgi:hypothetical protein